jgi:WD40 repeat protein
VVRISVEQASRTGEGRLSAGTGVAIGDDLVITCAHIEGVRPGTEVLVEFPSLDNSTAVAEVVEGAWFPENYVTSGDVAVLRLKQRPDGFVGAPILPTDRWAGRPVKWFGFARGGRTVRSGSGVLSHRSGVGRVQINHSRGDGWAPEAGFSGGPVWDTACNAVIGLLVTRDDHGTAHMIPIDHAADLWPDLSQYSGWRLDLDDEYVNHWNPRARAALTLNEPGSHFRGRIKALREIAQCLAGNTSSRTLKVKGRPGSGKSSVLARIVMSANPKSRALLGIDAREHLAEYEVSCAVNARDKTALDIARVIARALSGDPIEDLNAFMATVAPRLDNRERFNLVLDSIDEMVSTREIRSLVSSVLVPLLRLPFVRIVFSARTADGIDPVSGLGYVPEIDLDTHGFFEKKDMLEAVRSTLRELGQLRPDSPYRDDSVVTSVASDIVAAADSNFLVASLTARFHGQFDVGVPLRAATRYPGSVVTAIEEYMDRLSIEPESVGPRELLAALAFADEDGFSIGLWAKVIDILYGSRVGEGYLRRFVSQAAAGFLLDDRTLTGERRLRLFHRALVESILELSGLLEDRSEIDGEILEMLLKTGKESGWGPPDSYLRRSLQLHAQRSGRVDDLLCDDAVVLNADIDSLLRVSHLCATPEGQGRARLLRASRFTASLPPEQRAAQFSVLAELDRRMHPVPRPAGLSVPYWSSASLVERPFEKQVLQGHTGAILQICNVSHDFDRPLLASVAGDGAVRIWDIATGLVDVVEVAKGEVLMDAVVFENTERTKCLMIVTGSGELYILNLEERSVTRFRSSLYEDQFPSICMVDVANHGIAVAAGMARFGQVRVSSVADSFSSAASSGRFIGISNLVALNDDSGSPRVAAGCSDGTIWMFDPSQPERECRIQLDEQAITRLSSFTDVEGKQILAAASLDGRIRVLDPGTGQVESVIEPDGGPVQALSVFRSSTGILMLASSHADETIRIRDLRNLEKVTKYTGHFGPVLTLLSFADTEGSTLIASGGTDGTVRIWEIEESPLTSTAAGLLCAGAVDTFRDRLGNAYLLAGHRAAVLSLWNPDFSNQIGALLGHRSPVFCTHVFGDLEGGLKVAAGAADGSCLVWNLDTGELVQTLSGGTDCVYDICTFEPPGEGQHFIVTAGGEDGVCRVWDLESGNAVMTLEGHTDAVTTVVNFQGDNGAPRVASAGRDGTIRIWDPLNGDMLAVLSGHVEEINALHHFTDAQGKARILTGSSDRTVRIWEPTLNGGGELVGGTAGDVAAVYRFVLSGGRDCIAAVTSDRSIQVWDLHTFEELCRIVLPYDSMDLSVLDDVLYVATTGGIVGIRLLM